MYVGWTVFYHYSTLNHTPTTRGGRHGRAEAVVLRVQTVPELSVKQWFRWKTMPLFYRAPVQSFSSPKPLVKENLRRPLPPQAAGPKQAFRP